MASIEHPSSVAEEEPQQQQQQQVAGSPRLVVSLQQAFHPENARAILAVPTATSLANAAEKPSLEEQQQQQPNWEYAWAEATLIQQPNSNPTPLTSSASLSPDTALDANHSTTDAPLPPPPPPLAPTESLVPSSILTTTTAKISNALVGLEPSMENNNAAPSSAEAPYHHGYLVDNAIGLFLAFFAIFSTLLFELYSFLLVYLFVVALHWTGRVCGLVLLFRFLVLLLQCVDHLLLVISVCVNELLAGLANGLTLMSAGKLETGAEWHQYIRKLGILTRWVVRDVHRNWEPKRDFPLWQSSISSSPTTTFTTPTFAAATTTGTATGTSSIDNLGDMNKGTATNETSETTRNEGTPERPEPQIVVWD